MRDWDFWDCIFLRCLDNKLSVEEAAERATVALKLRKKNLDEILKEEYELNVKSLKEKQKQNVPH